MSGSHGLALLLAASFVAIGCDQRDPGRSGGTAGTGSSAGGGQHTAGAAAGAASGGVGGSWGGEGGRSTSAGPASGSGSGGAGRAAVAGSGQGGSGGPPQAGGAPLAEASLFPIKTGNSWSFRTTKGSEVGNKTQTVGALEMVGGSGPKSTVMAYKMLTTKDGGLDKTESWQAEVDGKIVRYREQAYAASNGQLELEEHWDPYKLRIDGTQLSAGATYTEQYRETKLTPGAAPTTAVSSDTWRIVGVNESVSVPAGTFSAVLIEKVGGTSTKRYWFVRGIGKVKEQSGSQLEELTSYKVDPAP